MSSRKEGCNFWLISGWFVQYLAGLWVVWMACGWFGVLQLTVKEILFNQNKQILNFVTFGNRNRYLSSKTIQ